MASQNECPDCARSGVGACDDFPDCQPKNPEPEFKYGDPVTVLNHEDEIAFIGMYVGEADKEDGPSVLVQHGDPHMDDPMPLALSAIRPGWPAMAASDDYRCLICRKERDEAKAQQEPEQFEKNHWAIHQGENSGCEFCRKVAEWKAGQK